MFVASALIALAQRSPSTLEALRGITDKNPDTREWTILRVAEQSQLDLRLIVPALTRALKDPVPKIRLGAAYALGNIGPVVCQIRPEGEAYLRALLVEGNSPETRTTAAEALGKIGFHGQETVRLLSLRLRDRREAVRMAAAEALIKLGGNARAATPALIDVITDSRASPALRHKACDALASIGPDPGLAVPPLIKALRARDEEVQEGAAWAIGNIGASAAGAVNPLRSLLSTTKNSKTLQAVAWALGQLGPTAGVAIADLLNTADSNVTNPEPSKCRQAAAQSVEDIASALLTAKMTDYISELKDAADILARNTDPQVRQRGQTIDTEVGLLLLVQQDATKEQLLRWTRHNRISIELATTLFLLYIAWRILLRFAPDWTLRHAELLDEYDSRFTNSRKFKRLLVRILLRLAYRRSVLNAWVAKHSRSVGPLLNLEQSPEELPVIVEGEPVTSLTAQGLRHAFKRRNTRILVSGEGSGGKTTVARQIARWCLEERQEKRPFFHRMLPVFLSANRVIELRSDYDGMIEEIRNILGQLFAPERTPPRGLVEVLLSRKRLFIITDGFSELEQTDAVQKICNLLQELPARALLVTFRTLDKPVTLEWSTIELLRVPPDRIEVLIRAFLVKQGERRFLSDLELSQASKRLSNMFRDGHTPVAAAKLYAKELNVWEELKHKGRLPESVPEMMLLHINQMRTRWRKSTPDAQQFQRMMKAIAWQSVRTKLRPVPVSELIVQTALQKYVRPRPADPGGDRSQLKQLINAGILEEKAFDRVALRPDILCEYLAAMHAIDEYRASRRAWHGLLMELEQCSPSQVRSFANVLWDCVLVNGPAADVPVDVAITLSEIVKKIDPFLINAYSRELKTFRDKVQARTRMKQLMGEAVGEFTECGIHGIINVRQAGNTSGDFPIRIRRNDGSLGICLVDVEGHGTAAAETAEKVKQALTAAADWGTGPPTSELMRADEILRRAGVSGVTMSFTVICPDRRTILHANAGMPYPLLFRKGEYERLSASGAYVGSGYGAQGLPRAAEKKFDRGDMLVLLSDGFREALSSAADKIFGENGIVAAVKRVSSKSAPLVAEEILRAVVEHAGKETPTDDQTIAVIQFVS